MSISIDRENFRDQLKTSLVLEPLDSDALDEAINICSEIFNQTIRSVVQLKRTNLTAIGTDIGIALFGTQTPYSAEGSSKRCKKNVAWVSLEPSSQDNKIRKLAIQRAVILKLREQSKKPISSLVEEGKIAIQLNHIPGVVPTFFSGIYLSETRSKSREPKEKAMIVSKECPKDLGDLLIPLGQQGESLPTEKKIDLSRQAIQIVVNLHHEGVIHGDIKIENFFVTEDGNLLIGDFEQVRKKDEGFNRFGGTVGCLSPEYLYHLFSNATPDKDVLERNDTWSLGCLILEIFTPYQLTSEDRIEELAPHYHRGNLSNLFKNRVRNHLNLLKEYPKVEEILKEILAIPPQRPITAKEALVKFNAAFPP